LGLEKCKPFECVGTSEEMLIALKLVSEHWFQQEEKALEQLRISLQSTFGKEKLAEMQSDLLP
jgi:hypothetical protein